MPAICLLLETTPVRLAENKSKDIWSRLVSFDHCDEEKSHGILNFISRSQRAYEIGQISSDFYTTCQ